MPIDIAQLQLQPNGTIALARQLYQLLHQQIMQGQLTYHERLPATRQLAATLNISRGVVVEAYDMLKLDAIVAGFGKGGTRVCVPSTQSPPPDQSKKSHATPPKIALSTRGQRIANSRNYPNRSQTREFPLTPSMPDFRLFPLKQWQRVAAMALNSSPKWYHRDGGLPLLKQQLCTFLAQYRGITNVQPQQVIITTGSQGAQSLLATLLCNSGDIALVESPCWTGTVSALKQAGLDIITSPLDNQGMQVPVNIRHKKQQPKIVITSAAIQFPTGITMTPARRQALVQATQAWQSWLIEDDYAAEYSYNHHPPPSILATSRAAHIIHIGTMSKLLMPALRMGWLVVPPALISPIVSAMNTLGLQASYLQQQQLGLFMQYGYLSTHLAHCRAVYNFRRKRACDYLQRYAKGYFSITDSISGMNISLRLDDRFSDLDSRQLSEHFKQHELGISVYRFQDCQHLLLGHTLLDDASYAKELDSFIHAIKTLTA
ncbi:aminotransferase-like domain-containing protein [Ostreibacterium oceani]|uniref:Aminotransferase class I/II-fold pyridoxal phosphate-dependent enzyme n=1 Tax=Ostreibacterium oceani TaxID=2654998 RepID=A0A6N7ERN4_9GAMM|nr:PLP-dependent aminotransferase family protein [Ostreibacterium oceani]MPV85201.1 aminotransferase class I/II-fold pyridoxal phosphate-dependent enzyme [Ostreibacterium oceani]